MGTRRVEESPLLLGSAAGKNDKRPLQGPFVEQQILYDLLLVAIAALGRAGCFGFVAIEAEGMAFVFAEFVNFAGFPFTVANFALHRLAVLLVVEGDVAILGGEGDRISGDSGRGGKSDEHCGNKQFLHVLLLLLAKNVKTDKL